MLLTRAFYKSTSTLNSFSYNSRSYSCSGRRQKLLHRPGNPFWAEHQLVSVPVQEASSGSHTLTFQHGLYSHRLFRNFHINFEDFSIWALQFNWRHLQEKNSYFHTMFRCYMFSWLKDVHLYCWNCFLPTADSLMPLKVHSDYSLLESTALNSLILMFKKKGLTEV